MSPKKRFIINKKEYYLDKESILQKFKNFTPDLVRKHYVEINGKKVGIKQAIYEVLEIRKTAFTSSFASSILERLGFEIKSLE